MSTRPRTIAAFAACVTLLALPRALAQPAPSFRASCAELRAATAALKPDAEALVTIEVEGVLRGVHFDGALAYLLLCAAPDPQVLSVTYATGGRKAGDRTTVTGAFSQRDADHILLDPCLASPPE
jgi:hypothetical protein